VKRFFQLVLLAVLTLMAVVLVRTIRFTPPPARAAAPVRDTMVNERAAAVRLARAVRIPTVSWSDSAPAREALLALHRDLQADFPRVHRALTREIVDGYSLLYTWRGTDSALAPIVLMGHLDVVPVEAAVAAKWQHGPFSGDITDGFIWGRGTLDDKVSVLAVLEAVETLLVEGYTPARTVILAFGHDEEVAGGGADSIVQRLRARGVRPAFVLDEGGAIAEGILPGVPPPVALVGIAEKGYVSVELTVEGTGGHSSMPPPETAVGVLAAAIVHLERDPFPARLAGPAAQLFDAAARTMPFLQRMAFANEWLFGPLILRQLEAKPTTNALVRTTTAPTVIEGSPKDNVLPSRARAVVNFRILPGDSVGGVIERVRRVVADPRVSVRASREMSSDPSPVSGTATLGYRGIARAAQEIVPGVVVAPWLVVGATDARHYSVITPDAYRFLPLVLRTEDLARIHGTDERVSVMGYGAAVRFMRRLVVLTTAAGAAP
jgi:carboxypeptidase PM20D1